MSPAQIYQIWDTARMCACPLWEVSWRPARRGRRPGWRPRWPRKGNQGPAPLSKHSIFSPWVYRVHWTLYTVQPCTPASIEIWKYIKIINPTSQSNAPTPQKCHKCSGMKGTRFVLVRECLLWSRSRSCRVRSSPRRTPSPPRPSTSSAPSRTKPLYSRNKVRIKAIQKKVKIKTEK